MTGDEGGPGGAGPSVHFPGSNPASASAFDEDADEYFGPAAMQGGAITDDVYRWAHNNKRKMSRRTRSESLHLPRTSTIDPELDTTAIKEPGGFRCVGTALRASARCSRSPSLSAAASLC